MEEVIMGIPWEHVLGFVIGLVIGLSFNHLILFPWLDKYFAKRGH